MNKMGRGCPPGGSIWQGYRVVTLKIFISDVCNANIVTTTHFLLLDIVYNKN